MYRHLEIGCAREAVKADDVAECLLSLSVHVPQSSVDIERLFKAIWMMESLLDKLPHDFAVHPASVGSVEGDLSLMLATVQGTLDVMRANLSLSEAKGCRRAWSDMHLQLRLGIGISAFARIDTIIQFIKLIRRNLKGISLDYTKLLNTRDTLRILHSRQSLSRGVPATVLPAGPLVPYLMPQTRTEPTHWAECIFEPPSHPTIPLRRTSRRSQCLGPWRPYQELTFPGKYKVLFKLTFPHGFNIKLCVSPLSVAKLLCRDATHTIAAQSSIPIQHLTIRRQGRSCMQLLRWSRSHNREWAWAVLYFDVWEKMVLFWCTFMALKWRAAWQIEPTNRELGGEELLFRATTRDDRYIHNLSVYRDSRAGIRLEAKAYEGRIRRCPIWTAFITHTCQIPHWLFRIGNRVYIREIHIYVFSEDYRSQRQRRGLDGELFLLEFVNREGAEGFESTFELESPPPSTNGSSVPVSMVSGSG